MEPYSRSSKSIFFSNTTKQLGACTILTLKDMLRDPYQKRKHAKIARVKSGVHMARGIGIVNSNI